MEVSLKQTVFSLSAVLVAILCAGTRTVAPQGSSTPAQTVKGPQERLWKSVTTNRIYRVRVDGPNLKAEWSNVPPGLAKGDAYIRSEARLAGQQWVGTSRSHLPCASQPGTSGGITNWCLLLTRIEFTSITATHITGRGETLKRFDCQSCKVLETGWANFSWVPLSDTSGGKPSVGK